MHIGRYGVALSPPLVTRTDGADDRGKEDGHALGNDRGTHVRTDRRALGVRFPRCGARSELAERGQGLFAEPDQGAHLWWGHARGAEVWQGEDLPSELADPPEHVARRVQELKPLASLRVGNAAVDDDAGLHQS